MRVRELSVRQQLFGIFLLCFLAGIIAANLWGVENFQKSGNLTRYFLKQFQYAQVNSYELLWNVGCNRLMIFFCLFAAGMLFKGKIVHILLAAWSGFAYGYFCVMAISGFGSKGILICMAAPFPQFVVYVLIYLGMVMQCTQCRKKDLWRRIGVYVLLLLGLCVGILLESYINPFILQKVLTLF